MWKSYVIVQQYFKKVSKNNVTFERYGNKESLRSGPLRT